MKPFALLSVTDKTGIADLGHMLTEVGYDLLSTGGTAKVLRNAGLNVTDVADYTAQPEMFHGRIKTLHPMVFGGILARPLPHADMEELERLTWRPIHIVVINLYDFAGATAKPDITIDEAIEQIDIGGPSGLRAAAKNYKRVTVLSSVSDYAWVSQKLRDGTLEEKDRFVLAAKAFERTAAYDAMISSWMSDQIQL